MTRALVLGAAVVALAGCPPSNHPKKPPMTDCGLAIEAFASADPTKLRPLPAGCTLADVATVLSSQDAWSRGSLGEDADAATAAHKFSSPVLPRINVWVDHDNHVVLLDTETAPATAEAYMHALGEPEQRLDYPYMGATLDGAEQLWLTRGIVVVASKGASKVVRMGVFSPCTLAEYRKRLRYVDVDTD